MSVEPKIELRTLTCINKDSGYFKGPTAYSGFQKRLQNVVLLILLLFLCNSMTVQRYFFDVWIFFSFFLEISWLHTSVLVSCREGRLLRRRPPVPRKALGRYVRFRWRAWRQGVNFTVHFCHPHLNAIPLFRFTFKISSLVFLKFVLWVITTMT